ncbi:MAG: precorrin isomerase [Dehalococcoidia bacterium]|nr:precorrin isomerase [Dehalococcoidia bacterium]
MSLVERLALLPDEIDRTSLEMVEETLVYPNDLDEHEKYILFRIVRAEGDPDIASSVRFSRNAVESGLYSLRNVKSVLTDVRMVQVGISKSHLSGRNIQTRCEIDTPAVSERAKKEGSTRSVAAIREMSDSINGSIVAIGNAPTALLALLDLIDERKVNPALIIGMPVGFVACAESKDELAKRDLPFITILGNRGGSSAAAAAVNGLLDLL